MSSKLFVVLSALAITCLAQRSPYAGRRPIGYPHIEPVNSETSDELGNRFGDGLAASTTTQRLPLEALGDVNLINRISRLPVEQQPFWYLNWKALEDMRKSPQTYPQKDNNFVDNASSGFIFPNL